MKLVINKCFGGFGLSHEAVLLYAQKKGITLYWDTTKKTTRFLDYYLVPVEEYKKTADIPWAKQTPEQKEYTNSNYYYPIYDRADPVLIHVVEELGVTAASGYCAELKIIEIPDGMDYTIHDYDGMESVHQTHQSWS